MSFAFGFSGEDLDDDDNVDHELHPTEDGKLARAVEGIHLDTSSSGPHFPPILHTLDTLFSALPSQISYNLLRIPRGRAKAAAAKGSHADDSFYVPRRSIFDIRTQLMVEADPAQNNNDNLLNGLDQGDLSSGIYEGGFKTWECAVDLASLVVDVDLEAGLHVIELGAGSAIPSLVLLRRHLQLHQQRRLDHDATAGIRFTLCDYNEDVLRLATAANVFLTHYVDLVEAGSGDHQHDNEVEDLEDRKVGIALNAFEAASVSFNFISGAWGKDLVKLIVDTTSTTPESLLASTFTSAPTSAPTPSTLILASETIYSPESTKVFAETLMCLLNRNAARSKAWVAAKKIYFGVGGGVQDFENEIRKRGGSLRTLLDVQSAGVGRVVLEVTAAAEGSNQRASS